jgi:hexosaminidase
VYSANDVKSVVQYAMERGIRVVPEFDVPGHAYSWGAYYDITANCPDWNANINNVPLNPTKSQTMEIVQGFLGEMAALFPDDVMHLGGDEVGQVPNELCSCVQVGMCVFG